MSYCIPMSEMSRSFFIFPQANVLVTIGPCRFKRSTCHRVDCEVQRPQRQVPRPLFISLLWLLLPDARPPPPPPRTHRTYPRPPLHAHPPRPDEIIRQVSRRRHRFLQGVQEPAVGWLIPCRLSWGVNNRRCCVYIDGYIVWLLEL